MNTHKIELEVQSRFNRSTVAQIIDQRLDGLADCQARVLPEKCPQLYSVKVLLGGVSAWQAYFNNKPTREELLDALRTVGSTAIHLENVKQLIELWTPGDARVSVAGQVIGYIHVATVSDYFNNTGEV